jgi:catechol 2,3-dioxygenase-like lactoylglutathione lyase family enzyme
MPPPASVLHTPITNHPKNTMSSYIEHFSMAPYSAADCARTRAFYTNVLDLGEGDLVEYENGDWFLKYRVTEQLLVVFSNHYKPIPGNKEPCLSFGVENLEDFLEVLKKKGISAIANADGTIFREISGGRSFRIADPDGHVIIILRHKKTPAETLK